MAEVYPWKPFFWLRVSTAHGSTRYTRLTLAAALPELALPMITGEAEQGLARVSLVEEKLRESSSAIGFAMSFMGTVELIGLRHLTSGDRAELSAQVGLRAARVRAEEVHRAIGRCRGHLGAVGLLLAHPDVPGVDGLIDSERLTAVLDLEAALQGALDVNALAAAALNREVYA